MKLDKGMGLFGRLFMIGFLLPVFSLSQTIDTVVNKATPFSSDSLKLEISAPAEMKLDVKTYSSLLVDNFKRQALFPLYFKPKDWLKLGGYGLITAASALANESVKDYAIDLKSTNTSVASASKHITKFGGRYAGYTLAGLFAYSAVVKNQKLKTTTLLASQAYFISNIIGSGIKTLTSVQGPFYTDPITNKTGAIFHGPFYTLKKDPNGKKLKSTNYVSFPSGHTYTAFSIATVFAKEYKDRPLVPIFCYTAATLVGLSRLTENRHWVMDIIAGGLLGYYSGKQMVNNYHRVARSKLLTKAIQRISLNVQFANEQFIPGVVYGF